MNVKESLFWGGEPVVWGREKGEVDAETNMIKVHYMHALI
jgi:hypothetical protein